MIKEVWELEVAPRETTKNSWQEVSDWLRALAQAAKKREEVIDAYGLRSETGNKEMFHTVYLVLTFENLGVRDAFYAKGIGDEAKKLWKKAEGEHYFAGDFTAHYYFNVLA
jgi:hypothetical protein